MARIHVNSAPVLTSESSLGLMGRDGLSTKYGPIRGSNHTVLGMNETNTVQSLLEMDDTYDFIQHVGDISYAGELLWTLCSAQTAASTSPLRWQWADLVRHRLLRQGKRPGVLGRR